MTPEQIRDDLVDAAARLDPEYADLVRLYYRYLPPEEVIDDVPAQLVGAVRSNYLLARQRIAGRPAVRVLNPTVAEDGWDCVTTVVQVVTDDMPYLVDSVVSELTHSGVGVQRVVHPIVVVRRSISGELREVLPTADPERPPADGNVESWMSIEVDLITDPLRARELESRLVAVLHDVREVYEDTDKMITMAKLLANRLEAEPPPLDHQEIAEGAQLLRWLADHHFTFLGYRQYELVDDPDAAGVPALRAMLATGLGVLRQDSLAARSLTAGPDTAAHALAPQLLVLTEASAPSTVHRSAYPYYVGVKTFDEDGNVNGEHRFLGVLTSAALYEDVLDIPVIERRVREVIHRAGFPLDSYSGQKMLDVIQNYPRPELLSTDVQALYETTTGVLALADRRRLRLFMRRDPYGRFYSCLVYLPRDRYTTTTRLAMQEVLLAELAGTNLEYSARVGETEVARVHFIVHTDPASTVDPDPAALQQRLADVVRGWSDLMVDAVLAEAQAQRQAGGQPFSSETAAELGQRYAAAFPEAYKEDFAAAEGLADLRRLQALPADGDLDTSFYLPDDPEPGERRFKLYLAGQRVTLSQVLPVLQRMGVEVVDERPYEIRRDDGTQCWIFDFGLRIDPKVLDAASGDLDRSRVRFQEAFAAAWRGHAEVDGFNALVLRAALDWWQAAVLRAYAKYLRQAGTPYSQDYIEDAVLAHTDVAAALVTLFETRFNPAIGDADRIAQATQLTADITEMIDEVTSLDEDRILRSLLGLVNATLRTNYHVRDADGRPKPFLAVKLDPQQIPDLPAPRPRFEIWVYSPRFEGVHLRFGPVARGGLRWSDRREDFRTEVLGLVKAQAVKNAVIVPVGAKGGFVLKRPPTPTGDPGLDREALQAEGVACYQLFISGLLDLTDNLDAGRNVVPARQVVRYDGDDTYLVVAADKGTATFSDIANDVAKRYGFWLGDAFASGGSAGYDHKAMGITAKGAWEAVKRHFRELEVDTQSQDFTVVGVGDMSGDVFGNGMLLSEHIRLVAAFDHRHIFIDPDPDPATSYAERRRLFDLPRSSWDNYDRALISEGGGVWPRTAKSIPVGPAARKALGLADAVAKLSPTELMRSILLAPVDLLWNGGIGTYVKASTESHAEVGDKANDGIRVNGADLRVRVVGEGGNLGLTQRGRVEFAREGGPAHTGGKVNTDALDNSAGVDCSDHEVNIKVLLDHLVAEGRLDRTERNELLVEMTDQVSELVLADNYDQNAVLGVSRAHAVGMRSVHARLIADLEQHSGLDRALEALPGPTEFQQLEKADLGLTSPELATLLAHVKLALKNEVLASDLPDLDVFARRLPEYFPSQLRERFGDRIGAHPLRREIITTMLVNEVVDGGGVSYAFRLAEEMSASATDAVRAYVAATRIFDLPALWRDIRALDNVVASSVADAMTLESRRLLDRASRWLLTNRPQPLAVGAELARFSAPVRSLGADMLSLLRGREREHVVDETARLVGIGVPEATAAGVASLLDRFCLLDVIEIAELAEREGVTVGVERSHLEAAQLYYALSEHLDMDRMLSSVSALERGNRWHSLARLALRDDLYSSIRAIAVDVLRHSDPGDTADEKIARWEQSNASRLERARSALAEIRRANRLDLPTLSVAARQVRSMVR